MQEENRWYRYDRAAHRITLTVYVQPGARRTEIDGVHGGALKVKLAERAIEGRANAALAVFIAQSFDVPPKRVRVLHGEKSRRKVVEILEPGRQPEAITKLTLIE